MQKESWEAFCFTWLHVFFFFFYLFKHTQDFFSFFFSQKYHFKIIP